MRGITRISLGIMAAVFTSAGPSPMGAQASAGADVCALIDAAEVVRITGRTPRNGQGPEANDASDFKRGERGCHFVDLQFVLVTPEKYRPVMVAFRLGNKKVAIEDQTSSDSVEVMKKVLVSIAKTVVPRMK